VAGAPGLSGQLGNSRFSTLNLLLSRPLIVTARCHGARFGREHANRQKYLPSPGSLNFYARVTVPEDLRRAVMSFEWRELEKDLALRRSWMTERDFTAVEARIYKEVPAGIHPG
jgi:hypothetical protein